MKLIVLYKRPTASNIGWTKLSGRSYHTRILIPYEQSNPLDAPRHLRGGTRDNSVHTLG